MPVRNGTGPMGQGPMTGRGLGNCPGAANTAYGYRMGLGMGRRSGFGMGRRAGYGIGLGRRAGFGMGFNRFYNEEPIANMSQKEYLTTEMDILKERLEVISSQLENLTEDSK